MPPPTSVTLTQVLASRDMVRLYGQRLSDLSTRGSLGLPLDPDGPVGFALIRAYVQEGRVRMLRPPQLLSVHGDGHHPGPEDTEALPDELVWLAGSRDPALCLALERGPLLDLLQRASVGAPGRSDGTPPSASAGPSGSADPVS